MSPYEYGLLDAMKRERDPANYDINLWFRPKVKPVKVPESKGEVKWES